MPSNSAARSLRTSKAVALTGRNIVARGPPSSGPEHPIIAIGASAGGLEAFRKLVEAVPDETGMVFIIVQHLDPSHVSLLVELLAGHTSMPVSEAMDGVTLSPDHVYVIPPGAYLSVADGKLCLSRPQAPHGARMPFDFLLRSLADESAASAVCVILSGTGADGSEGAKALRAKGGFVIVQDPDEAEYDGMPRSAIMAGVVDLTLKLAKIPAALIKRRDHGGDRSSSGIEQVKPVVDDARRARVLAIIDLLRTRTSHDFTLYKPGTLTRRIERRMAMDHGSADDLAGYLEALKADPAKLEVLAKDLLINVTSFFRDPEVFDDLAKTTIPDLVRRHDADQPLRIWVAGCSTGEETYSLAMLLREEITASGRNVKLQIFASDVDGDAVAVARDGLYAETIAAEVSPERLARFFSKEDHGYKISADLRASVVFTVHDVLSDPPFSRVDLISCRNLLIYLGPEAQAKVIALFHFALRPGGLLLLGKSETAGSVDGRFEVVKKAERLYRRVGRSRPGDVGFAVGRGDGRAAMRPTIATPSRQTTLAELARRMALRLYAPALVLINRKMECLYFLGPTDRFLHHAEGIPTNDLMAMAPDGARAKLRAAIREASPENPRVRIEGAQLDAAKEAPSGCIEVHSLTHDGEELLLVGFLPGETANAAVNRAASASAGPVTALSHDNPARIAELERELDAARTELHGAIRNLELSNEEQKAVNEEALSVNEEFQSTNEELLTSKEELQSLNEELTALNSQLQETLDRQRTTSNDLQNVLYSTDVATLFLDVGLNIRFFTPATKSLFNIIPGDIGRPLADLQSLATDTDLATDARAVLKDLSAIDREIETKTDTWFIRRILPYRNHDDQVEGVVITFTDISERKRIRKALELAKLEAEQANRAKSRFLAAASHDLRQPLQTIAFVQGLLARTVEGEKAQKLVQRLEDTLQAMSGMLNALLDINQIEAGVVQTEIVSYKLDDVFDRMREEFSYHAEAKALTLKVARCSRVIHTDPRLLEQLLRNLLTNAIKYTRAGKVLMGCRRLSGSLSIEIWDTGIGIPETELQTIFEEYHQLDNPARERSRGLGLGLAIVQRLVALLGYKVHVRSRLGKGSVFAIEIALPVHDAIASKQAAAAPLELAASHDVKSSSILVVEDDPDVRELLAMLLQAEGHEVTTAFDGFDALELVGKGRIAPDLVIADYNLPNGMNGVQIVAKLRAASGLHLPAVILTGDISTVTLTEIARGECVHLSKPVKLRKMMSVIETLLAAQRAPALPPPLERAHAGASATAAKVYIVDDDLHICDTMRALVEESGYAAMTFTSSEAFLAQHRAGAGGCLLVDAYLPGMNGFALLQQFKDARDPLPIIMITGHSDVPMAVQAMKAGAVDFIEKPVTAHDLLASVARALEQSRDAGKIAHWRAEAQRHMAGLTVRQKQIMDLVLAGHPSKNIAADLGISQRTVENHRNAIMTRTGCKSLPALARLALAADPQAERPESGPV